MNLVFCNCAGHTRMLGRLDSETKSVANFLYHPSKKVELSSSSVPSD